MPRDGLVIRGQLDGLFPKFLDKEGSLSSLPRPSYQYSRKFPQSFFQCGEKQSGDIHMTILKLNFKFVNSKLFRTVAITFE